MEMAIHIYIYIHMYIYDMCIHVLNLFIDGCGCRGVTRNSDDVLPGDWAGVGSGGGVLGPSAPRGSTGRGGGGGGSARPAGHADFGGGPKSPSRNAARIPDGLAILDEHGVPFVSPWGRNLLDILLASRRAALPPTVGGAPPPSFADCFQPLAASDLIHVADMRGLQEARETKIRQSV